MAIFHGIPVTHYLVYQIYRLKQGFLYIPGLKDYRSSCKNLKKNNSLLSGLYNKIFCIFQSMVALYMMDTGATLVFRARIIEAAERLRPF